MNEVYVVVLRKEGEAAVLLSAHPTEDLARRERQFFQMRGEHHVTDMEVETVQFLN